MPITGTPMSEPDPDTSRSDGAATGVPILDVHPDAPAGPVAPLAGDLSALACPVPISRHRTVQLGHGSGGRMMNELIRDVFLPGYGSAALSSLDDFGLVMAGTARLAMSTDSFVVDPIFFPGGDIGKLAVCGTVNDVAMSGARPLYLAVAMLLEEGFPLEDLRRIVQSIGRTAAAAGVAVVTGDTKVVNRGKGDGIYITTTGVGIVERDHVPSASSLRPGDMILVNGPLGDHGMAVMSKREGLEFDTPIESDCAALHGLVATLLDAGGSAVHALRDATRGGLAAVVNEFAESSGVGIRLREDRLPVRNAVAGACSFLGLDVLSVANEGKVVVVVARERARDVLDAMRAHPLGRESVVIGDVCDGPSGMVTLFTSIGGQRIVDLPVGELLPRIC